MIVHANVRLYTTTSNLWEWLTACGERLIHFNGGLFLADEVALQQAVKQNDVHDRHDSKSDAAEAVEHKGD